MDVLIKRNSGNYGSFAMGEYKVYTTTVDNQSKLTFKLFEGEHILTAKNQFLGIFEVSNIQPARRGVPRISIRLAIDMVSTLIVTARDEFTEKESHPNITYKNDDLSEKDIVSTVAKYDFGGEKYASASEARNKLETYCRGVKRKMEKENVSTILKSCNETIKWLDDNQSPEKEQCIRRQMDLESICSPIMKKLCSDDESDTDTE